MKSIIIGFCFLVIGLHAQKINTSLSYSVVAPDKITPKTPVLILLHGYGGDENDLLSLAPELDKKFLVFSLRGPASNGRGGPCWFPLEFIEDQRFKYSYSIAKKSTVQIASFVTNACRAYKCDSTQVYLMGFSQGAIISYDVAFSHPEKIKGVLALSGLLMPETAGTKTSPEKFKACRFFVAHGTQDHVVKYSDGKAAADLIKSKGAKVTFKSYTIPHTITSQVIADVNRWLISTSTAGQK